MALTLGDVDPEGAMVRVQAAPPSWSFLEDGLNRAAQTARRALEEIAAVGSGALVLMHASMGSEKRTSHAFVRDFLGEETQSPQVSAEVLRDLGTGCQILVDLGFRDLRILTSSSRPIVGIEAYGLNIIEKLPI